jgi:hypothetical protein
LIQTNYGFWQSIILVNQSKSCNLALRPFGQTIVFSVLFFCLFYLAGELAARSRSFQSYFIHQTWDSRHGEFEKQLARLDRVYLQEGRVDCIFLGNSMVWRGFDPEAFQRGYRNRTGEELRCFNFGVDGMPARSAGALAKILIEDYQPQLLIYGTDARDYAVPADSEETRVLTEMDWLNYRLGQFSPKGWLIDHSELYRYRFALQHLLHFDYQDTVRSDPDIRMSSRYGFDSDSKVGDVEQPPDANDPRGHIQYYFRMLWNYEMLPENLEGLRQVLSAGTESSSILVVEMPVPDTYMLFFSHGEADYRGFVSRVDQLVQEAHKVFWQTTSWDVVPEDGWVDYSHLNQKGAAVFSQALGDRVGQAVQLEILKKPNH